jgi:hypothetical protein
MNKLYDVLEICLQELENGASLDNILARYPDLANDLRPILKASIQARRMAISEPSPEVLRRGRAKVMQRASEMREAKVPLRKRVIPTFQRFALSIGLTAALLLSGTGLVGVSASALPGENLYPVKRTWEDVRLLLIFNNDAHDALKSQFENERLHEASELIIEGRHELIQFAGVFTQVNSTNYVSGIAVMVPPNLQTPELGVAVMVTGRTNAQGFVELESIEVLPDGVFVPIGKPVEMDTDFAPNPKPDSSTNSNENSGTESDINENSGDSSTDSEPVESHQTFEVEGIVESLTGNTLVINGKTVYLENATIEGDLKNGVKVEIKGYYAQDGRFMVTALKVKSIETDSKDDKSKSISSDENSDSNSINDSNSNGSSDSSSDSSNDSSDDSSDDGGGD